MSVKIIEDSIIRRIDKHIYNAEDSTRKNTLKDVKIIENTAILFEVLLFTNSILVKK